MDTKQVLISFVDILLRVPSLFILDEIFHSSLADLGLYPSSLLPLHKEADFDNVTGESNHTMSKPHISVDNFDSAIFGNLSQNLVSVIEHGKTALVFTVFNNMIFCGILGYILQICLLLFVTIASIFTLTLWTKQLVKMYEFMFSLLLVYVSYRCNQQTSGLPIGASPIPLRSLLNLNFQAVFESLPGLFYIISNIATQSVLASGYLVVNFGPPNPLLQAILALSFLIPSFTVMLPMKKNPIPILGFAVISVHVLCVIWFNLPIVYKDVKDRLSYVASFVRTEGLMAFAETEWLRLNVPLIFRTFWLMRCLIFFAVYAIASPTIESVFDRDSLMSLFKIMLVRGCETLPAILGMSSIFSWISGKTYIMCQHFLLIPHDELSHVGPVSAVLFIILSFQNGLSTLKPAARIVRLMRNVSLLIACFLHFVHNAVDPVLMSLAASANPDVYRHARALFISAGLTLFSFTGLFLLWTTHAMSTWLLAVSGFSVEVISKVCISLALYGLFLADAKFSEFWDKLDDHVYRVRFAGRMVEFLVGLFLLCNSAFILVFESGGAIRALLVGLHAYFNLWCEARVGWKIFTRRRTAVHKIATLETVEKLDELDDVCAICFHDLKSTGSNSNFVTVKVTPCRHYFHAVCLRKWLYVQDRCPMCHQTLWPQMHTSNEGAAVGANVGDHLRYDGEQVVDHLHED